ncbi:MAG TPA: HAD domain-containing protein [Burkholderiaceae bacterium]|jgi:hypothetical protein
MSNALPTNIRQVVLSIDFDGVLHPLEAAYAVNDSRLPRDELLRAGLFCHCQLLEDLLRTRAPLKLIVHSSWRLACPTERIRELLGPLGHRLRGVTPTDIADREESILEVLRRWQVPKKNLVVLDDHAFYFRTLRNNVVKCPSEAGLVSVVGGLTDALDRAGGL